MLDPYSLPNKGDSLFPYPANMPTQDELPYSDDEKMESECHAQQLPLMKEPLEAHWADRPNWYIGTNMFVYFSPAQELTHDFKGPDVFVVLGVKPRERKSYLLWEEGKAPDVIIEFLSDSTLKIDKGLKMKVYQDTLKVPEYFWCHPYTDEFAGYRLEGGVYRPIKPDDKGMLYSEKLGLSLTRWRGYYGLMFGNWLRWAKPNGELLPTSIERAAQAIRQNEEAQRHADEAVRHADEAVRHADEAQRRADEAVRRADEEKRLREMERMRAEDLKLRAEKEQQLSKQARLRARKEKQRADDVSKRAELLEALLKKNGIKVDV